MSWAGVVGRNWKSGVGPQVGRSISGGT